MERHPGWVMDGFLLGRVGGEEEMTGPVQQRGFLLYVCVFKHSRFYVMYCCIL